MTERSLATASLALLLAAATAVSAGCAARPTGVAGDSRDAPATPMAKTRVSRITSLGATVTALRATEDGCRIAAGTADGRIVVMRTDGTVVWSARHIGMRVSELLSDSTADTLLARLPGEAQSDGETTYRFLTVRPAGTKVIATLPSSNSRSSARLSVDGKRVLISTSHGASLTESRACDIAVFDAATGRRIWGDRIPGAEFAVVDATADLRTVVLGGVGGDADPLAAPKGVLRVWRDGRPRVARETTSPLFPALIDDTTCVLASAAGSLTAFPLASDLAAPPLWRATADFPGTLEAHAENLLVSSYGLEEQDGERAFSLRMCLFSKNGATVWAKGLRRQVEYRPILSTDGRGIALLASKGATEAHALYVDPREDRDPMRLPGVVTALDFAGSGDRLVIGTDRGEIRLLQIIR